MIEGDATLHKALRAARTQERDRRQRLAWVRAVASSYALDGAFIALFAAAGVVPVRAAWLFAAGAVGVCALTYAAYSTGWNRRFRDPSLVAPQVVVGVALQLMVVALAPGAALPLLANVFTVFAFGLIWLSLRAAATIWLLTAAGVAALMWHDAAGIGAATATPFQLALSAACVILVLGRCLVLNMYANQMRSRLSDGRRMLAASLEQIQELVHYDELTKAYNRRTLIARLEEERARARRTKTGFSVALMDLDHFKSINDTYGHAVGDDALRAFAETVHANMRATDVFGRYGGEEFLMILVAAGAAEAARGVARVQAALARRNWSALASGLTLTFSAGVTAYHADEAVAQMLGRADAALYEAKAAGRNQISIED